MTHSVPVPASGAALEFDLVRPPRSLAEIGRLRDEAAAVRRFYRRALAVLLAASLLMGLAVGWIAGMRVWAASSTAVLLGQDGRILLSAMAAVAATTLTFSVLFAAFAALLRLIRVSVSPGFNANDRLTLLAEVNSEDYPTETVECALLHGASPVVAGYFGQIAARGRKPVLGELRAVREYLESEQRTAPHSRPGRVEA